MRGIPRICAGVNFAHDGLNAAHFARIYSRQASKLRECGGFLDDSRNEGARGL